MGTLLRTAECCKNSKPDRLWSLLDMINFRLDLLFAALQHLRDHKATAYFRMVEGRGSEPVRDPVRADVESTVHLAAHVIERMALPSAENRVRRAEQMMERAFTHTDLEGEFRVLIEAVEDDCEAQRFYQYPASGWRLIVNVEGEWLPTLGAFPSAKLDIEAAVDLYALGHPTASVFHAMRVAEMGLRALAKERRVTFTDKPTEWATWQDLITQIGVQYKAQWGHAKRGPERDAALDFYAGALSHFEGFKDKYRNAVSHARKRYETYEALIALNHVRDFMNGLSGKIGEKTRKPIGRWP
jgi:hypothetical protein